MFLLPVGEYPRQYSDNYVRQEHIKADQSKETGVWLLKLNRENNSNLRSIETISTITTSQ